MVGERLKLLRLARGLTMDALAAAVGGLISKQAISKYELGKDVPSPRILTKLAAALGVKSVDLWREPTVRVELIAYRKGSGLNKTEQRRVESLVVESLERRVRLQELTNQATDSDVPVKSLAVESLVASEQAAKILRSRWRLGLDPIGSMTGILEDHLIHVIEIAANDKLDGVSAVAKERGKVRAAAVVSRQGLPGERQRFNLAHELGHLVMEVAPDVDEEKAAFRFAGAFLAPVEVIHREVGKTRRAITGSELLLLKRSLGMSMQAILFRLRDLDIISEGHYRQWCVLISKSGYRKMEPNLLPCETPTWLYRTVLRALTEGLMSKHDAERTLGSPMELPKSPLSLIEHKAFMALSVEQRRQRIGNEAKRLGGYYDGVVARGELDVADTTA